MTPLMDKARKLTGLTEKISIARLTSLMNHFDLHVNPNLLDNVDTLTGNGYFLSGGKIIDYNGHKAFKTDSLWNQVSCTRLLDKGTYTFSETVSGPLLQGQVSFYLQNSNGSTVFAEHEFPVPDDGKEHRVSNTFVINTKNQYRFFFTNAKIQLLPKLEVGDLATPLEKVGGGS